MTGKEKTFLKNKLNEGKWFQLNEKWMNKEWCLLNENNGERNEWKNNGGKWIFLEGKINEGKWPRLNKNVIAIKKTWMKNKWKRDFF